MTRKLKTLSKPRILQDSPVERPGHPGEYLTVSEAILMAANGGNPAGDCALFAGISAPTLSSWLHRGTEALARLAEEKPGDTEETPVDPLQNIPEKDRPYAQLVLDLPRKRSLFRMRMRGHVAEAAKSGEWRAAVAALQADERGSWCPPTKVELSGPNGGPLESVSALRLDHEGVRALEATLRLRAAERRAIEVGEAGSSAG